jgi:hypothetical protein
MSTILVLLGIAFGFLGTLWLGWRLRGWADYKRAERRWSVWHNYPGDAWTTGKGIK